MGISSSAIHLQQARQSRSFGSMREYTRENGFPTRSLYSSFNRFEYFHFYMIHIMFRYIINN